MSSQSCNPRVMLMIGALTSVCLALGAGAQQSAASADSLARAVRRAPVSLARGISAARSRGKPISAKYEMENGTTQLSVYTERGTRFWEVIVDHRTGRIAKAEEIKEGDDLIAAKAQSDAMAKATRTLHAVVTRVLGANPGAHVLSVVPSIEAGHPVAMIRLVTRTTSKTVTKPLD